MNVRIGNYEIQPLDQMNWTVSRVAEDGEDVKGRKKALDGTPLLFLGKYSPPWPVPSKSCGSCC